MLADPIANNVPKFNPGAYLRIRQEHAPKAEPKAARGVPEIRHFRKVP
jgi:hypothetical protein